MSPIIAEGSSDGGNVPQQDRRRGRGLGVVLGDGDILALGLVEADWSKGLISHLQTHRDDER